MKIKKIFIMLFIITLFVVNFSNVFAADLGDIKGGADGFIQDGELGINAYLPENKMKEVSDMVYSILLAIAVAVAVIVGLIIGIKFMLEGAEGKAEIKKALVPYIAGCIVVFGSFGIWKIVVDVLQNLS